MTDSLYPEDTLVVVDATTRTVDTFGRVVKARMTGRTDGIVFYSMLEDFGSAPIDAALSQPLLESGTSGVYSAVFEGSVLEDKLGNLDSGTPVYRHAKFTSDAHFVARLFWRSVRT